MPALRVKVENSGQPATRVELPADAVYQEALASILGAVGLQQGVLSLNKKARNPHANLELAHNVHVCTAPLGNESKKDVCRSL